MSKHLSNNDYYTGWTPSSYRRTQDFLRSAVKVDAKPYGNGVRAIVYIDYESMDNYVNANGYQVVEWANTGYHGGLQVNHKPRVWDETMENTINNGELLKLAIAYLKVFKKNGLPILFSKYKCYNNI